MQLPVACLDWTHDRINQHLAFGSDEYADHSIFKLFDDLLRGRKTPLDIDVPLNVVVEKYLVAESSQSTVCKLLDDVWDPIGCWDPIGWMTL